MINDELESVSLVVVGDVYVLDRHAYQSVALEIVQANALGVACKEIRAELAAAKKSVAQHRMDIATLKRETRDQARKMASLEKAFGRMRSRRAEVTRVFDDEGRWRILTCRISAIGS